MLLCGGLASRSSRHPSRTSRSGERARGFSGEPKPCVRHSLHWLERQPRGRSRQGFTLIELLVVIAIIVVLAALLLPTLARVKSKVFKTQCISNQKQIGLAYWMYTGDASDSLPTHPDWTSAGG